MIDINYIIIHDSASSFGDVFLVNQWHKERGFKWRNPKSGVIIHAGYHYIIYNGSLHSSIDYNAHYDGLIVPCRPEGEIGAHCAAARMNHFSIGICLIGDGEFTKTQLYRLALLCKALCGKYNIEIENILGHHEVDEHKRDPRIEMNRFRQTLRDMKGKK